MVEGKRKLYLITLLLGVVLSGTAKGQFLRGEGDFEFFVDVASLPEEKGLTLQLIQIAVPTREIYYKSISPLYHQAALKVEIVLRDGEQTVFGKALEVLDVRERIPSADDLASFIYYADSCSVVPGNYQLSVRISDLRRKQKKYILGLIGSSFHASVIEQAEVNAPSYDRNKLAISEPILIWSAEGEGKFIPNPMGIYGLKNDTLSFISSALLPASGPFGPLQANLSVLNYQGEIVDQKNTSLAFRNGRSHILGRFDVNTYPAGNYRLIVDILDESGLLASTGKDFTVAWKLLNWRKPRRDVLVEARIIFEDDDYNKFQQASIGEQERILDEFWKSVDPTPHTAVNEVYEKFMARLSYADKHFKGFTRGALTDMGQIFIRFGSPNEVVAESVPFNREDLNQAIDKLNDKYKVVLHQTMKGPGTEDSQVIRAAGNVSRPYRGSGMDTGAYELWVYNLKGDPLLKRDQLMTVDSGLRYLFVDKNGVSEYQLVSTSQEDEGSEVTSETNE